MPYRAFKFDFATPVETGIRCVDHFADLMASHLAVEMDDLGTIRSDTKGSVYFILTVFIAIGQLGAEGPTTESVVHLRNGTTRTVQEIMTAATAIGCTQLNTTSVGNICDKLPNYFMAHKYYAGMNRAPNTGNNVSRQHNPVQTQSPDASVPSTASAVERMTVNPELHITVPIGAGLHTKGQVQRTLAETLEIEPNELAPIINVCSDNGNQTYAVISITVQDDGLSITLANGRSIATDAIVAAIAKIGGSANLHNFKTESAEEAEASAPAESDGE